MVSQYAGQPQQPKTRLALILVIKGSSQPYVLFFQNPQKEYEEFVSAMKTPNMLIEKEAIGPIKKIAIVSNTILSVLLQEEQYA